MLYTSGTTGAPKGVCRPLLALLAPGYDGLPPFARDLLELFELGGDAVRYLRQRRYTTLPRCAPAWPSPLAASPCW